MDTLACNATIFSPALFGAEILSLQATLVTNYSAHVLDAFRYVAPSNELKNATFCNITVTYTHPGQGDKINVETWLPHDWNGRLLAVGGGGWVAGRAAPSYGAMHGALADGFATLTTDAGLESEQDASPWALASPGNVNLYNLQNLGSVSLIDEATIGKALIQSFYGRPADYSYWTGCSQGGRQGLMLAQRTTEFDGIIAGAPALHTTRFVPSLFWPQQLMNEMGVYPHGCEIDAITAAAIQQCDGLDGVIDGVISLVDECRKTFDPFTVVGREVNCSQNFSGAAGNSSIRVVSEAAAQVVNATWQGSLSKDGRIVWPGLAPGADLTGLSPSSFGQEGVASTNCTVDGCTGLPNSLGKQWLELFAGRGANIDTSNLTRADFDALAHEGVQRYSSLLDTEDADLTRLRDAGGKLITFHGLADNTIPPFGTESYFNAVAERVSDVGSFMQYYEVPGLGHCYGGASGLPTGLLAQLQAWVENGTAPERTPVSLVAETGIESQDRILCPYPRRAQLDRNCASPGSTECWLCV